LPLLTKELKKAVICSYALWSADVAQSAGIVFSASGPSEATAASRAARFRSIIFLDQQRNPGGLRYG
jgi:hypothetical protein